MIAWVVALMGDERLLKRVISEELVDNKGYSGGQEEEWMRRLKTDLLKFGVKDRYGPKSPRNWPVD